MVALSWWRLRAAILRGLADPCRGPTAQGRQAIKSEVVLTHEHWRERGARENIGQPTTERITQRADCAAEFQVVERLQHGSGRLLAGCQHVAFWQHGKPCLAAKFNKNSATSVSA